MEVSRRVQRTKKSVTNHDHTCGVQLMLITMAAALPIRATTGQGVPQNRYNEVDADDVK